MKFLRKTLWFLLYLLPAVLFFSYHPVIRLGSNDSMNFELSLPLLWLVLFDLGSFILLIGLFYQRRHQSASSAKGKPKTSAKSQTKAQAKSSGLSKWGPEFPGLSDRRFFLLTLFPLYLTISVFWSANPLRGLLTAGVMWAVFFAVFSILFILPQTSHPRRLRLHVLAVLFVSTLLICKFCYAQSIMDVVGLSRESTLLCPGCTYHSFGFPHPSGFAIEPQFMGNLLLAPTLTALYLVVFRSRRFGPKLVDEASYLERATEHQILHDKVKLPEFNWKRWQRVGMILLTLIFSTTLFFTFSRGAIYAYAVAILVMLIFLIKHHTFRWSLITIPLASLLISLGLQGTFAAVGPTAETFVSGVTKSIHQLSLGIIDLRPQDTTPSVENSDQNCGNLVENPDKTVENLATIVDKELNHHEEKSQTKADQQQEDAIFEGYVPESTNIRLSLNQTAFWTWLSAPYRSGTFPIGLDCSHADHAECNTATKLTPTSVLFGVGLGGAGTAMHAQYPDRVTSPKEIVQHQGFSLLLETGLVGIALAIFGLLIIFAPQLFSRKFLDGKSATQASVKSVSREVAAKASPSPFWHHPALPLLLSLTIAYLVTLNFFSGLPNALQIYLMPPLLYRIFADQYPIYSETTSHHKSPRRSKH